MYTNGLDAAIVLAVIAVSPPVLWMAWWLFASLGESVGGRPNHPRPAA